MNEGFGSAVRQTFKDLSSLAVNPMELKSISNKLNEAIKELLDADKEERLAWESAKQYLGPKMALQLKEAFEKTDNEFYNAYFLISKYADSLNRVSNVWDNAEERIMRSINSSSSNIE